MSWLFLPCKKWLCSGWYHGPDMSICLLGHWLLKSPCLGAFQQELQSGSWVTFQRNSQLASNEVPINPDWRGGLTITQTDVVSWPSHFPYHPLVPDLARSVLPRPPYSKMFSSWTSFTMYPGGSLNPPTSVSGHRHVTLYPTWIVSK